MTFIEAIQKKHLIDWLDHGFLRALEPHMYAKIRGGEDVLIAYQIDVGPTQENTPVWKILKMSDSMSVDTKRRFATARTVPPHLRELVREIYASTT